MWRHEDDRELMPSDRELDQRNCQTNVYLPSAKISDSFLHGIDLITIVDNLFFTIRDLLAIHFRYTINGDILDTRNRNIFILFIICVKYVLFTFELYYYALEREYMSINLYN